MSGPAEGGIGRLLALFAHPDDESFAAGGTIALAAAAGVEVTVVCATDGAGGGGPHGPPPAAVARQRRQELDNACQVLGAGPPLLLGLPDGGLADLDPAPVTDQLRQLLGQHRPAVVLTMGNDGAYGHRDHLRLTRLLGRAVAGLPIGTQPWVLHSAFPCGLLLPVWQALHRLPGIIDTGFDPACLGTTRDQVDLVVDINQVSKQKLAAIACHRSQLQDGDPRSFLRPGLITALLAEEWFCHAAGPSPAAAIPELLAGLGRDHQHRGAAAQR